MEYLPGGEGLVGDAAEISVEIRVDRSMNESERSTAPSTCACSCDITDMGCGSLAAGRGAGFARSLPVVAVVFALVVFPDAAVAARLAEARAAEVEVAKLVRAAGARVRTVATANCPMDSLA